jgi:hypothetical protein
MAGLEISLLKDAMAGPIDAEPEGYLRILDLN